MHLSWPYQPRYEPKIILNCRHLNEASKANLDTYKRIIKWQPQIYGITYKYKIKTDLMICFLCFSLLYLISKERRDPDNETPLSIIRISSSSSVVKRSFGFHSLRQNGVMLFSKVFISRWSIRSATCYVWYFVDGEINDKQKLQGNNNLLILRIIFQL